MKRFVLFAGVQYYPQPSMFDVAGSFSTLEEAKAKAKAKAGENRTDWAHVLDTQTGRWWEWLQGDAWEESVIEAAKAEASDDGHPKCWRAVEWGEPCP